MSGAHEITTKSDVVRPGCRRTTPRHRLCRAAALGTFVHLRAVAPGATASPGPGHSALPRPDDYLVSECIRVGTVASRFGAGDLLRRRRLTSEFDRGGSAGFRICTHPVRN